MFIKTKNAGCFTVIVILLINLSIGAWSISESYHGLVNQSH